MRAARKLGKNEKMGAEVVYQLTFEEETGGEQFPKVVGIRDLRLQFAV